MEKGWVKVATYTNELTSEMMKLLLEEQGIPAVLLNKQDSSLKFGRIELFVPEEDVVTAMNYINAENSDQIDED
ncbi:putative signal transducing protein [Sphingobacterium deserti]|uniref:DUF2007 domain-containing protein n=1 Tax=Sphingobacterium deserti TaxID=1229276 RepID=A0A0B8T1G6_9SPHI|nr:DUF2007 domain-containing protein [Sphingobacterium deserti]KGE14531.1 hypothetical protein DI53_1560 [Sphingobacterium deserti]